MTKVNIGITGKDRQAVASLLNQVLADEHILYNKTRSYHWNVESPNFSALHKFFEEQYTTLAEIIDEVAERVRKIGHYAEGRLKELVKLATLDEPEIPTQAKEQLSNLLVDHELIIQNLRKQIPKIEEKYNDVGSSDFLTGLIQQHEEMAWMLRAHLA
ncbi:MAG: DNA starvation/stationary phase protection protein [Chitinophagaceae bacterium]|nr:DNA starvation/stationary phase protection protein [Chitinophagaceae bacterium]